jgi:hypothetical protein
MREAENLILYRFDAGYVKASRYLTKPEIEELEGVYGECRGYCVSADLITVFAVCELFEKVIEKWMAQGGKSPHQKHQTTQGVNLAKKNYTRLCREV